MHKTPMRRFRWTQNVCYYRAGEGIDNKHAFYYYRAEVGLSYVRTGKVERGALRPPVSDYYTGKFEAVQKQETTLTCRASCVVRGEAAGAPAPLTFDSSGSSPSLDGRGGGDVGGGGGGGESESDDG